MQRSGGLAWLNIDGSDDPGYRYRMPPAIVRLEQRGKSGHTLLDNCVDVSRALKRPPQYLTKFCGLAVGAMSAFDEAQGAAAMRGDFPASMIQAIVFAFVREWCLCKSCGLPETDIEVTKKSVIFDCKACGKRAAADMEHKLASFIFNNPPNAKGTGLVERGKNDANRAEKEERRREREASAEQKKREREERRRRRRKRRPRRRAARRRARRPRRAKTTTTATATAAAAVAARATSTTTRWRRRGRRRVRAVLGLRTLRLQDVARRRMG